MPSHIYLRNMRLRIQKIDPEAHVPSYAYDGDAGMDIRSIESVAIQPGERQVIRTGLKLAIPEGYAGFVWDKSGLSVKNGLTTLAGLIDSNYRGELQVVLMNLGSEVYEVENGSKIAQLVLMSVGGLEIEEGDIDDVTDRGEGGFGSSGL